MLIIKNYYNDWRTESNVSHVRVRCGSKKIWFYVVFCVIVFSCRNLTALFQFSKELILLGRLESHELEQYADWRNTSIFLVDRCHLPSLRQSVAIVLPHKRTDQLGVSLFMKSELCLISLSTMPNVEVACGDPEGRGTRKMLLATHSWFWSKQMFFLSSSNEGSSLVILLSRSLLKIVHDEANALTS